jgi:DNA invertase Pin-like site-specific DNA recombinase
MNGDHVAIYAGLSHAHPGRADPDAQKQLCDLRSYADRQGWRVMCEFVDFDTSGRSLSRRGLRQMLDWALAKPPKFIRVLIECPDRLFRDTVLYQRYCNKLEQNGVEIVATALPKWRYDHAILAMPIRIEDRPYGP